MNSIADVVHELDQIIETCRQSESRLGYFPALYRKVTLRVAEGIERGEFVDGPRMERLDVIFARRYIDAYRAQEQGENCTASWKIAFDAGGSWQPIVLQHILLGINAHINLDLGIAAAQTTPGATLDDLEEDFNRINQILFELVAGVKEELTQVWPLLAGYDFIGGNLEDGFIRFSLSRAREHAWSVARRMAVVEGEGWQRELLRVDREAALRGRLLSQPPLRLRPILLAIRMTERGSTAQIIELLR